jgi:ribosomal protein S18 acetylase RimI-like enzyme
MSASVKCCHGGASIIGMRVRPLSADDQSWKYDALVRAWGSTAVARKGVLVDAAELPGFVAEVDGRRAGLVTYARRGDELEIVTIHVDEEGRGVGRALMDAVVSRARDEGVRRIWLTTTNDNLRAVAFYQRWGMDLVALIRDGVAASRLVKPSIPMVGRNGIPIRHELEFELLLNHR